MENETIDLWKDSEIDMMRDLIYPNMEEYRLLLTKAQGSPYENYLHDLTQKRQEKMLSFLPLLQSRSFTDIRRKKRTGARKCWKSFSSPAGSSC